MAGPGSNWRRNKVWGFLASLWGGFLVFLACVAIPIASIGMGRKRAFLWGARMWCRGMRTMAGIRFRMIGWEDLPADIRESRQPAVFMSNHQSHLDPPFLIGGLPVFAVFIAKRELKWVPFLGQLIWFMQFIFINRQNRQRAIESIRDAAEQIRRGKNVVIFPEGTRTPDGRLKEFKKGGFALALDSGVPIVPIGIRGGFNLLPKGSRCPLPGDYTVHIGQPVSTADGITRDQLMDEVRARILTLSGEVE